MAEAAAGQRTPEQPEELVAQVPPGVAAAEVVAQEQLEEKAETVESDLFQSPCFDNESRKNH